MSATLNLSHQDIYTEVRALLLGLFSCEVVQGWSNNVPMPKPPFIVMQILNERSLSTTVADYDVDTDSAQKQQSVEVSMQLDFYNCAENARIFVNLWRDYYAADTLKQCQPLHTDDPKHLPIINEENQYESRWMVTAAMQYNPVVHHEQAYINDMPIVLSTLNHIE